MRRRKRQNFSLVELLVVIVLMAAIMSIGVPAFNTLISGGALKRSATTLDTVLNQARFQAISSRKPTALIFDFEGKNTNGIPSMRLAAVRWLSGNVYHLESFVEGGRWIELERGTVFTDGRFDANVANINHTSDGSATTSVLCVIQESGGTNHQGVVFSPYGSLYKRDVPLLLSLADGQLDADGKLVYSSPKKRPENWRVLSVNPFTGKITQTELFKEGE